MRRGEPRAAWIAAFAGCLAAFAAAGRTAMNDSAMKDAGIRLEGSKMSLVFRIRDGRVSLASLTAPSGPEWLGNASTSAPLWRLSFARASEAAGAGSRTGEDGAAADNTGPAIIDVSSGDAVLDEARATRGRAVFTWSVPLGAGEARVVMTARRPGADAMSEWTLSASLPDGWNVARADFPMISGIRPEAARKLAAPYGWGLEYHLQPGVSYEGTYPSCAAAMPFLVFHGGGQALYAGAHDAKGSHKTLRASAGESGASFAVTEWPSRRSGGGRTYRVPHRAVIGVVPGGYLEAARVYRAFSFQTPWGKGGPVSKRPIPRWLKETDLWLMPGAEPLGNVEACRRAGEFFGVPTALHWYNWHQIPFDTLYPDYFPARPSFAEGVKALQKAGFHVMPYINGRLADPNSRFWSEEKGNEIAARRENGEPYEEVYGSKVPLRVMCPAAPGWRDKVVSLVDRLVNECGVDGVYIDQIGAAAPVTCFHAAHPHAPGGGAFWVGGYRRMLDRARKRLPAGRMLTTEENGECWIDQLDALLLVNTPTTPTARPIPLFPAVYSGRAIVFGFQYIAGDDLAKSVPFRTKMAQAFLWGSQLGWVGVDAIMAPAAASEAEFLRNLARCRRRNHEYLAFGRFLGSREVEGDGARVRAEGSGVFGGAYPIDLPAVMAAEWEAEDGRRAIALVNLSDESRTVTAPWTQTGESVTRAGKEDRRTVTVPPRDAVVVEEAR